LKLLVILEKYGDLGNRLFRYARFFSAIPRFVILIDLSFYQYAYLFEPQKLVYNIYFKALSLLNKKRLNLIQDFLNNRFVSKEMILPDPGSATDFVKSEKVFMLINKSNKSIHHIKKHSFYCTGNIFSQAKKKKLQRIFTLKDKYTNQALELLKIKKINAKLIGVHIRRGDYKIFANGKFFFSDEVYVASIVNLTKNACTDAVYQFLLISNEVVDTNNYSGIDYLYFGMQDVGVDQALLLQCDYIIGVESTFSGWVSFINDIPIAIINNEIDTLQWDNFSIKTIL